jgi:hypothetical protein
MPDPAPRQPAWLDGLAPDGAVLRATSIGTTDGLYSIGIAGFGVLFVLLTILRNGNLAIAAAFGIGALWFGVTGGLSVRQGMGHGPVLAYDAVGLYVPGAGCIRWTDVRQIRLYRGRRSFTITLELEPARRAQLGLRTRLSGRLGRGDVRIAGAILPVSTKSLLDAIDPLYRAATGRRVPG